MYTRWIGSALFLLACGSNGARTQAPVGSAGEGGKAASSGGSATSKAGSPSQAGAGDLGLGGGGPSVSGDLEPSVWGSAPVEEGKWRNITPKSIDPGQFACTDIAFAESDPSILFAYYSDGGGVRKSTDSGATWQLLGNMPMPNSMGRILIDPEDPNHLYSSGSVQGKSFGFWVSLDGGVTWGQPKAFVDGIKTWGRDVYNVVADPTDFNHILLSFHAGWACCGNSAGVLESKDGGISYITHAPADGMDHAQGIAFLYSPEKKLGDAKTWLAGAGYNAGLFRTTDAGETWTKVHELQQNHGGFDVYYSAQGYVYIGATEGVFRSVDNGATWEQMTDGVPPGKYYTVIGDGTSLFTSQSFVGSEYNKPFIQSPEGIGETEGSAWSVVNPQTLPGGPWKMKFDKKNRIIYNAAWSAGCWAYNSAD